jgi:hypothetical protein
VSVEEGVQAVGKMEEKEVALEERAVAQERDVLTLAGIGHDKTKRRSSAG